jgi:hypothetical protein
LIKDSRNGLIDYKEKTQQENLLYKSLIDFIDNNDVLFKTKRNGIKESSCTALSDQLEKFIEKNSDDLEFLCVENNHLIIHEKKFLKTSFPVPKKNVIIGFGISIISHIYVLPLTILLIRDLHEMPTGSIVFFSACLIVNYIYFYFFYKNLVLFFKEKNNKVKINLKTLELVNPPHKDNLNLIKLTKIERHFEDVNSSSICLNVLALGSNDIINLIWLPTPKRFFKVGFYSNKETKLLLMLFELIDQMNKKTQ